MLLASHIVIFKGLIGTIWFVSSTCKEGTTTTFEGKPASEDSAFLSERQVFVCTAMGLLLIKFPDVFVNLILYCVG